MSKKSAIIFAIVIVTTAILFAVYFSITKNRVEQTRDITSDPLTFQDFVPFGTGIEKTPASDTTTPDTTPTVDTNPTENKVRKLRQVSIYSTAGFTSFFKDMPVEESVTNTENTATPNTKATTPKTRPVLFTRQVDKATGHIYETNMETFIEEKVTNTTIPRIYEAFFGNNGTDIVYRYLSENNQTIETYKGEIVPTTDNSSATVKGAGLQDDILDMSLDQASTKVFYLYNFGGQSVGNTSVLSEEKKSEVFKSDFTEWLSGWIDTKTIGLQTKASSYALGYYYSYDLGTKTMNKIIGGVSGLTVLPNTGASLVMYSSTITNSFTSSVYNVSKRQSVPLDNPTMPEKCVWEKDGLKLYCAIPQYIEKNIYPDSWYQGTSTFNDSFYEVDASTGFETKIINPTEEGVQSIDGVKLSISPDGKYLLFINKKDYKLWSLAL